MMTLDFPLFVKKNITDIHMTAGKPALIRSEGLLMPGGWIPSGEDLAFFLQPFLSKEKQTCLIRTGSCDTAFSSGSVRCRLHIYRSGTDHRRNQQQPILSYHNPGGSCGISVQ